MCRSSARSPTVIDRRGGGRHTGPRRHAGQEVAGLWASSYSRLMRRSRLCHLFRGAIGRVVADEGGADGAGAVLGDDGRAVVRDGACAILGDERAAVVRDDGAAVVRNDAAAVVGDDIALPGG